MRYAERMGQTAYVIVSTVDRERLEAIVADRNQRQKYVEWARIVLASANRGPAQRVPALARSGLGGQTHRRRRPLRRSARAYRIYQAIGAQLTNAGRP